MTSNEHAEADNVLFSIHARLDGLRTCWTPPSMCGFNRSDASSITGMMSGVDLGAHGTPEDLSPEQIERMMPAVRRIDFSSVHELWDWENAPDRTPEDVAARIRTVLTSHARGVLREARRLLTESEWSWKPLGTAFRSAQTDDNHSHAIRCTLDMRDANGQTVRISAVECEPSHPQALCYNIVSAVYAAIHPRGRLQPNKGSDKVIPGDYILRVLYQALAHGPDAPTATPCRHIPPIHVAWTAIEDYEQTPGRTRDQIRALFDRAIALEKEIESLYGRVEPMPLQMAYGGSAPPMRHAST